MQPLLEAAFSGLADVLPVSFGIDPRWYAVERQPDTEKPIWLAITRLTADKLGPLFEWSESLFKTGKRELHLFGPAQEKTDIPDWVRYHGAATPAQLCESWFPRASGLITLSRHAEGRPQVMLEAMASGLPIVASSNPAHASIIAHGRNGLLCSTQEGYAEAIESVEDPVTGARLAEAGREYARAEFGTWDDCVNRYRKIYERLLFPERSGA
jgi:glycosyltransferase involved in cell wall biosynthesis